MPAADRDQTTADVQATCCATLVDQWVRDGVSLAMVAPGSRSRISVRTEGREAQKAQVGAFDPDYFG